MSEHNAPLSAAEQLEKIQRQLVLLTNRVEWIEKQLGVTEDAPWLSPKPDMPTDAALIQKAVAAESPAAEPATRPPVLPVSPPLEKGQEKSPAAGRSPDSSGRRPVSAWQVTSNRSPETESPGSKSGTSGAKSGPQERERPRGMPGGAGNWETVVGGKWALWVGSVAVFFAVAFFLAYTWHYLNNAGRLAVGMLAGTAFLGAGAWTRDRVERWFGEGLTGAGLAILYLSLWAGAQRYGLLSFNVAFSLMALTTALGVVLAVRYDAVSLSALATIGGFLTPVLLHSPGGGGGQSLSFLTYIALLNGGILAVSLFKRWQGIVWLSFVATLLLMIGWVADSYTDSQRWMVFSFVTLYFLLFLGAACFYSLIRREETRQEDLLLLFTDASIYALAGYALLNGALGRCPGAFPFALTLFFAGMSLAARTLAPNNQTLRQSAGGLALLFLTITIPTQLHRGWIFIGWSVEAAVLLTLGLRLRASLLRQAGQVVWVLSLFGLLWIFQAEPTPRVLFLNERALPLLVSVLASGWMAVISHGVGSTRFEGRRTEDPAESFSEERSGTQRQRPGARPDELSWAYAAYSVLGGAWLIAQETFLGFQWHPETWGASGTAGALFVIACLWAVYSLAMFGAGLRLGNPGFRLSALTVAALAAVLPMWVGMALPAAHWTPFWNLRWLSFVLVAATLGVLSWLISKEQEQLAPAEADAVWAVPVLVSLVLLCGGSVEIYDGFRSWTIPSGENWATAARFALAIFWSLYAVILLRLGLSWKQAGIRQLAFLTGGAAVALLLVNAPEATDLGWLPLLNLRFFAFLAVTAMIGAIMASMDERRPDLTAMEKELAGGARLLPLVVGVILWGLTQETYETFRFWQTLFGPHWDRAAQMGISLVWTVCGVLLLIVGVIREYQPIRLLALGLLGLTVSKVFLFDLGSLDTPYRILSFGALGLALIGISWLYSRYGPERAH